MAKIRIGFGTELNIGSELSGIGTDNPTNTKQVIDNIHATNVKAVGVSTLATYQGFLDKEAKISHNIDINSQAGTLGEIVIDSEITVSSGSTLCSSVDELTLTDSFSLPTGNTDSRIHCKTAGSMRFNEDLGTLEFYTGDEWRTVNSFKDTGNRGRAVFAGSSGDAGEKFSEYVNISSLGNSVHFGFFANNFASGGRGYHGGCASETRGIIGGGWQPGAAYNNIDYFTVASEGDTVDFGNLQVQKGELDWCSSSTRGITAGGELVPFANTNTIDYIQISTIGNSLDFGDISTARRDGGMTSSPINGFLMGGLASSQVDTIDLLNIASTGNGIDFGSLSGKNYPDSSVVSNGVAGFIMGGVGQGNITILTTDKFTFASGGNATVFGNLLIGRRNAAGASNLVRGLCAGGGNPSGHNVISYITMSSAGDAQDFGDLSVIRTSFAGLSDCHGGLGGY
tara:strand:+ start:462 stop:1823 length:1362 start_codon:yes stop_codon:yes gene_type:complete